jgi:hypothetical protein
MSINEVPFEVPVEVSFEYNSICIIPSICIPAVIENRNNNKIIIEIISLIPFLL